MKKLFFTLALLLITCGAASAAQQTITVGTAGTPADLDVNFQNAQANFTDLYGQAATKWASGTTYTADNQMVAHGGNLFICILGHTASAAGAVGNEPGVGDAWTTYWKYYGADRYEVAGAVSTHEGETDPHPGYVLESAAGTAHTRDAEDTLTDGSNLPDGAAIIAYIAANYQALLSEGPFQDGDKTALDNLVALLLNVTRDGNDFTFPGGIKTTYPDGSIKITLDPNTIPVSPTPAKFEIYVDSDNKVKINVNGTEYDILNSGDIGSTVAAESHNHTGVYEPADGTILKDADIGSTVATESADVNTVVLTFDDVSSTLTGKNIRIPTAGSWNTAYSWCDASESALVYTLYYSSTLGGSFSSLGTIAHDAAAATDSVDISSFTATAAGGWIHLDITTAGTGATACTLALTHTNS